jgi:hypothetical protein
LEHIKKFGFVPKFFEKIETFCFCKKDVGTHQKVLVLFQNFWNTSKCFGFVSILSFDFGTFLLSFLSVSGSGSTLPDPDPLVRGMDPDPDPDPNPSMRLLHKSECKTLSWPQQHSHSREKVLVNSLLQAN